MHNRVQDGYLTRRPTRPTRLMPARQAPRIATARALARASTVRATADLRGQPRTQRSDRRAPAEKHGAAEHRRHAARRIVADLEHRHLVWHQPDLLLPVAALQQLRGILQQRL